MRELVHDVLAGEEAWVVGGAVRDRLLDRPVLDLDVVCAAPERAARACARETGRAPFPLSSAHGAWRVVLPDDRTIDFTPLHGSLEDDLRRRDFTVDAMAEPLAGGTLVDPLGGRGDVERRTLRAVSERIFEDDPLRLLRAARLEDELGFRLDPPGEKLVRAHASLVQEAATERVLAELERLSAAGYRRLAALGLLQALGGSLDARLGRLDSPSFRLVAAFGGELDRLRPSRELERYARVLLGAEPPSDDSPRAVHRFRRATEPWSLDALAFLGAEQLREAVETARRAEPAEPLVRGDELGLPPGPEIGRTLELIAEERAAGTIETREQALELARRVRA